MGFIILRLWDWCCKSKGFCKKPEYDLTNVSEISWKWVELSLKQFRHHTRQLTVTNPSLLIDNLTKEK